MSESAVGLYEISKASMSGEPWVIVSYNVIVIVDIYERKIADHSCNEIQLRSSTKY